MRDFVKVPALSGIVTIKWECKGNDYLATIQYCNTNKKAVNVYGINVILPYGVPYEIFELTNDEYKKPDDRFEYIPVFMLADKEGYYSRKCPVCNKLFRTKTASVKICPYCGITNLPQSFITEEQENYIKDYTKVYLDSLKIKQDIVFDLDLLNEIDDMSKQKYYFYEKKQQTTFKCSKCGLETNIIGLYAYCPVCARRNSLQILNKQLELLQNRIDNPRYTADEREERDEEWREITKQCVSSFEAFARDIINEIKMIIPMLPSRKKMFEKISFHNPTLASEKLEKYFGINIFDGIGKNDKIFIHKHFLRRHIYEHCGGIADQEYILKAKEKSLKVGQLIREKRSNLSRLIYLVKRMASNLDRDFHLFAIEDREHSVE